MIIILKKNADPGQVENLKGLLRSKGVEPHVVREQVVAYGARHLRDAVDFWLSFGHVAAASPQVV